MRPITPYGDINPYVVKTANSQVSDYKPWLSLMGTLAIIREYPHLKKHAGFRPNQFQNIPFYDLLINHQTIWNVLQMRQHVCQQGSDMARLPTLVLNWAN